MSNKRIPLHSLVLLVGSNCSGKSKFAKEHFKSHEVVDAEQIKFELCGTYNRFDIYNEIFEEIKHRIRTKLAIGERVVVDYLNLKKWERVKLAQIANDFDVPVFYIIINCPLDEKISRSTPENKWLVEKQHEIYLKNEADILKGDSVAEVVNPKTDQITIIDKLPTKDLVNHLRERYKGVTIIPDIHGTLQSLKNAVAWASSTGKFVIFLGDLIDYGPKSIECIEEAYDLVMAGKAAMILGNHEIKIYKWLTEQNRDALKMKMNEGNQVTIDAFERLAPSYRKIWLTKFRTLIAHSRFYLKLDNIILAHAGIFGGLWNEPETITANERARLLYGQMDNEVPYTDNRPNRVYDWVDEVPQNCTAIVGHDIRQTHKPLTVTNQNGGTAVFMDTGSGKGGNLSTADIKFNKDATLKILNFNQY